METVAKGAVKITAGTVTAVGGAISALTGFAINGYAECEQLVGGVETLYKTSAGTVRKYAAEAYKTAGLSANDYMETATSFAAALVNSLGGNTAKAADMANTAITDMADNSNKMGTAMSSIQDAYNGFAKQNYTMLDNLKLGYGGTKTEMQRLLDDANKLNAAQGNYTKYSIDSYSDIVSAIHDVQNEMGITGTTAKEASTTIQGSVNATKSAWSNLVTGIADDNADFDKLISNFVDSASTAASNIIPRIKVALNGAAKLIESLVPPIMAELPSLIETVLPQLAQSAVNIVQTLATEISDNSEQLIDSAIQIITVLGNGIYQMLPTIAKSAFDLVMTITSKISENLPAILDAAGEMIIALASGIWNHLPEIAQAANDVVTALISYFAERLPDILENGTQILISLVNGIIATIPVLVAALPEIITTITGYISENIPTIIQTGFDILTAIITGIMNAIPNLIATVPDLIAALVQAFADLSTTIFEIGNSIVEGIKGGIAAAWGGLVSWFNGLWNGLFGNRSVDVNVNQNSNTNGSHAGGLDYVPFNNYVANLHRGEMVLTAQEAENYRRNGAQGGTGFVVNQTIYAAKQTPVELAASTAAYFQRARWAI